MPMAARGGDRAADWHGLEKRRKTDPRVEMLSKNGKFGLYAALTQFTLLILYCLLIRYDPVADARATAQIANTTESSPYQFDNFPGLYAMFQDIHVMIFIGFGFLMTFLKKYGYSAVGLNLFLAALAIELYILVMGIFEMSGDNWVIYVDLLTLINADFAAAAILISFGAVLGKTSPLQLLLMVIFEVIAYSANNWINASYLKAADVGGSMVIHVFGAYFGLTVALILKRSDLEDTTKEGSVYHSDLFSMIGTVFLWIFWPSFNAATAQGDDQHRAVINTYIALVASCLTAFFVSNCVGGLHRFNMVHVQNATLAGGVAVGTAADTMLQPYGACIVGTLAGLLSTVGYQYIQPFLLNKIQLHDTCGVNNLHGMPGLLAGLVGIIMLGATSEESYGTSMYEQFPMLAPKKGSASLEQLQDRGFSVDPGLGQTPQQQAGFQAATLATSFGIAVITGAITGFCMKLPWCHPLQTGALFDDQEYWDVPEDEVTTVTFVKPTIATRWHYKVAPNSATRSLPPNPSENGRERSNSIATLQ